MTEVTATDHPLLDIQDVFKIFEAGGERLVALRGASLRVERGEFVALLGRSGSGKSTLLHLVAGLDTPSAGREIVNGTDMTRAGEEERATLRRQSIGFVLQRDNLISYLTAEENVALPLRLMGKSSARRRAKELLARVGLEQRAGHRPHQLSGGEAQRVSIAVALAAEPEVLLGDEITGELDSETAAGILDLLADLHRKDGMTLLVVTHDAAVAARAQRIVHMSDGLIVDGHE